ncbi:Transcriptional regulator, contains XRE-family HTH domain [Desulfofundulus australicus DSM 11792]|uniref:Transcriptional regulator, contains XRE-family HTH domain n=1 Tax=Desulfofundulus australicus DSM 11792 TaxID=1121425 RepID=A0A1M5E463_9FIRM|nr:helix-turn-helix transcriptional regulator [Desulfofundulus australicus]SHF74039.1 Transcriptional regulator, contains XRE-family HTH domain [Desulfofundulus australicus DSM 11792]
MGTNRVRYFREKAGLSVKELARKTNLHTAWVLQVERAEDSWGRTPWGYDTDKRFADALGVKLGDLFSDYRPPERPKEEPLKPDTRTEEEIDETIKALNEWRQAAGKIHDERDTCHYEETSPGVMQGFGDFHHWQRLQKQKK